MARVLLCGDVMTGRGVDQILPHPSAPEIFEHWVTDARGYVTLAEAENGPVPRSAPLDYPWGEALEVFASLAPDVRIANLETSVTRADTPLPKGINYRMEPANVGCLTAAGLDVCVLANNHVLDFGTAGLRETLTTLHAAGLRTCGAGRDRVEARIPAIVELAGGGRVLVFAVATDDSGVPESWAARADRPGVDRLAGLTVEDADRLLARIAAVRRAGDVVVLSIHWGGNWGYEVPPAWVRFAHHLVDGGVDVLFGHSSHHPRPAEVYRDRAILYGCGDLLNDYEGISGHEAWRPELVVAWVLDLDGTGAVRRLGVAPFRLRRLRLERASPDDRAWLCERLTRVSLPFRGVLRDEGEETLRLVSADDPRPVG
jgi:poly-gamma-glutamate capsule biosynthesis protein CapA/YwtB (metallophosphatase superfamily)